MQAMDDSPYNPQDTPAHLTITLIPGAGWTRAGVEHLMLR